MPFLLPAYVYFPLDLIFGSHSFILFVPVGYEVVPTLKYRKSTQNQPYFKFLCIKYLYKFNNSVKLR